MARKTIEWESRDKEWWKDAVIYQIYIRSFYDSNGDGVGDLPGITAQLGYLENLGVDMIWLSPFCVSPNDDNGYDVSNYEDVQPEYGSLDDLKALIESAENKGIAVMMDLVFNHSSDEHPWFIQSRSSKDNPKRDWYIWAPPGENGKEPNNWTSYFGGSTWEWDEATGEYYLHTFSKKQPDLNWDNPELRAEMYRIAHFWADLGIKGFRLDAIHHIGKPSGYPDFPDENALFRLYKNLPQGHTYLQEFHREVLEPRGILTVGETGGTSPESALDYIRPERKELDMIFHFRHVHLRDPHNGPELVSCLQNWTDKLQGKAWDAAFFSNHDLPRSVSVYGEEGPLRRKSAGALAALLLTSWGTPFVYQGEEIGMPNTYFSHSNEYRDPHALRGYHDAVASGEDPELAWGIYQKRNRDNSRTPMLWDSSSKAGFTKGEPWIGINPHYPSINVAHETRDPSSVLHFYQKLIGLRKQNRVLTRGKTRFFTQKDRSTIIFLREIPSKKKGNKSSRAPKGDKEILGALVMINWGPGALSLDIDSSLLKKPWYLAEGNYIPPENQNHGPNQSMGGSDFAAILGSKGKSKGQGKLPQQGDLLLEAPILRPWEARIYFLD